MKLTMTYQEHAQLVAHYLKTRYDGNLKLALDVFQRLCAAKTLDAAKEVCVANNLPEWIAYSLDRHQV